MLSVGPGFGTDSPPAPARDFIPDFNASPRPRGSHNRDRGNPTRAKGGPGRMEVLGGRAEGEGSASLSSAAEKRRGIPRIPSSVNQAGSLGGRVNANCWVTGRARKSRGIDIDE